MREYDTGATRNNVEDKPNYEGFLSPLVIKEFGRYMHRHRHQADGNLRDGDNWQKGMPTDDYIDSLLRHVLDVWLHHRGYPEQAEEDLKEALCAIIFNTQGYLLNTLLEGMEPKTAPEQWVYDWVCAICNTKNIHTKFCPTCQDGLP
jgi:hypothetical protein